MDAHCTPLLILATDCFWERWFPQPPVAATLPPFVMVGHENGAYLYTDTVPGVWKHQCALTPYLEDKHARPNRDPFIAMEPCDHTGMVGDLIDALDPDDAHHLSLGLHRLLRLANARPVQTRDAVGWVAPAGHEGFGVFSSVHAPYKAFPLVVHTPTYNRSDRDEVVQRVGVDLALTGLVTTPPVLLRIEH